MKPATISTALKEWAVVQRSLLEGHQIFLLRKGGLIEETGEFDLRSEWFALYPTYEHETERLGDIQPCFGQWLEEEEAQKPSRDILKINAIAQVTDCFTVTDREKLYAMSPQHIWNRQYIDGRFEWEPYKPLFALIVRAYSLPTAFSTPIKSEYGGCKSWITLADPISIESITPVLSDISFERRREITRKLLSQPVTSKS